jgi:hypothetical protein
MYYKNLLKSNIISYRILENGLHISLDDVVGQVAHKGCERRLLCTTKIGTF